MTPVRSHAPVPLRTGLAALQVTLRLAKPAPAPRWPDSPATSAKPPSFEAMLASVVRKPRQ